MHIDRTVLQVDEDGNPISVGASSTVTAGTKTATTTPAALAVSAEISEVVLQSDPDNTVDILVGDVSAQTFQLAPGDSITVAIDDPSKLYVVSVSSTAVVNYLMRT